jgi:HPt (histidine-containing phosphotransfer) domain-containing protein
MKTAPPAHLANVVNASVTMFFHSLQPIIGRARPALRLPAGQQKSEGAMPECSGAARLAETGSNWDAPAVGGFDPPLDLVHLARQCLGDHELETELLELFRLQAPALTAQIADPSLLPLESKAKIAHKLRGSALSVGAGRVARAASRIEEFASAGNPRSQGEADRRLDEAGEIAALLSAVTEAVVEIDRILG